MCVCVCIHICIYTHMFYTYTHIHIYMGFFKQETSELQFLALFLRFWESVSDQTLLSKCKPTESLKTCLPIQRQGLFIHLTYSELLATKGSNSEPNI